MEVGSFELGLIFDNIFATVDLTEYFRGDIIWFYIEIHQKNSSFHIGLPVNLNFC